MTVTRDVRSGERMVRHARSHGGVNRGVLVTTLVLAVIASMALSGLIPGFRPADRLGIDVAAAVGSPLAERLDDVASRSVERAVEAGGAIPGDGPAAPALAKALPTWTGGGVDDDAADPGQGPGPSPTATQAPVTSSPGTQTAATTPPSPSASIPSESSTSAPSLTTASTPTPTTSASATGSPALPDLEQRLVDLTNAERAKVGCPALAVDTRLVTSADAHAVDMVAKQYFDHSGADGSTPTTRGAAAGYPAGVAENIGTGFTDAAAVMTAWLASPGHRANIVDCAYKVIGVGYDPGALPGFGPGTWVQAFGSV